MTMKRYTHEPMLAAASGRTWTVCDPNGIPVEPVAEYLHYLTARNLSVNTIRAYAQHLAALLTYLSDQGLQWDKAQFKDLTDFMTVYRSGTHPLERTHGIGSREVSSAKAAAAAIRGFYGYHRLENQGNLSGPRIDEKISRSNQRYAQHFLQYVERPSDEYETNRLSHGLKGASPPTQIINFEEDFKKMLEACLTLRDKLLISALYDLGLRLGAAVGLQHGDLNMTKRTVQIERRVDNPNGALSKRRNGFSVHASQSRFFKLYRNYLLNELVPLGINSDFIIVNLRPPLGKPITLNNAYIQVCKIGNRAGLENISPHALRHTHATALARAGWTNAQIAARLGHRSASSADIYIHLAEKDLSDKIEETKHLIWPLD